MKLKTLNDFENSTEYFKWGCDSFQVCLEDIKAEAIKWIKEFKERDDDENKQSWIKHFFNITKEDLEEQK